MVNMVEWQSKVPCKLTVSIKRTYIRSPLSILSRPRNSDVFEMGLPMLTLPPERLARIFSLTDQADINECRLVCRKFKELGSPYLITRVVSAKRLKDISGTQRYIQVPGDSEASVLPRTCYRSCLRRELI